MKKFKDSYKEFKEFINKGSIIDLAIGVIIGGAFGKIVTSLVNDIIMPLVGILVGGIDLKKLQYQHGNTVVLYGNFLQNVMDFLIIALCIFVITKFLANIQKKLRRQEQKEELKEQPNEQLELLKEIRNELKKQNKKTK